MAGNLVYLKKNASDNFDSLIKEFNIHLYGTDRGRSARSYCSDVKKFAEWMEARGGSALSAAPLDIVEYRQHLQAQGRKPSTVNRKLVSLRIFYSWLEERKLIPDNPAGNVKPVAD
ncbi:MAG: phage integrase N-terminal SAM-like domain-containing protein [Syntrophomonadaceae bacterium]|nr:phage integrase N-terminal SAM-like domain-containing protein [Syntrophomonadaceae bacterium]